MVAAIRVPDLERLTFKSINQKCEVPGGHLSGDPALLSFEAGTKGQALISRVTYRPRVAVVARFVEKVISRCPSKGPYLLPSTKHPRLSYCRRVR